MTKYDDELLRIRGWASMPEPKKEWLQQKHREGQQAISAEQLAAVSGAIVLLEIDQGLEGEKLKITNYIETAYPASPRASFDRLKKMRKIAKKLPMPYLRAIAERGARLLPGNAGIPLGELLSAVDRIPPKRLPAHEEAAQDDPKTIDAFISQEIPPALKAGRKERQQKATKVKLDDEAYTTMVFRGMDLTIRNAREEGQILGEAELRSVLKTSVSWIMHRHKLRGTLQVKATDIPEGIIAQVGRPVTKSETAAD